MPNYTTNTQNIRIYYTQKEIDSFISEKKFDILIQYSPYLTIKSIKDEKIDPNILTYDHYIKLATLYHTTLRDIDDIVNNVVSLNNDQKNEIKQKSKETREAVVNEDIDKFVGIINNSMKLNTQVEGKETQVEGEETQVEGKEMQVEGKETQVEGEEIYGGKTKNEPDSLSVLVHELCLAAPSRVFSKNSAEAFEYLEKDFTDNARKFIDKIASEVKLGNITPETNPGLTLLQQAFSVSNEEKSQEKAIRDITKRGRILLLKHALPILAEELWKNKTMEKAITDGENQASNDDTENFFNTYSGYFRDLPSRKTTVRLAKSGRRTVTEPDAPPRNVAPRVTQPLHGHGGYGLGGYGLGGYDLGGHGL